MVLNVAARLGWSDEQWAFCQLFIFDSHRPIHYNNIHFDRMPMEDKYGNKILDDNLINAKAVIVDTMETMYGELPTLDESLRYDEDFSDYDDDGSMPAHRRRVGDIDDSTSVHDEDVIQAEKKARAEKREANLRIEKYSSRSYHAGPSAFLMFTLAVELRKDTNEALWWGIIGLTDQFVNSSIGRKEYESILRVLIPEVSRLNPDEARQAANIGRIIHLEDHKFMLFRYWTLYDSMYHCEYIATNLQLWKDRKNDSNQLRTLLAKMGIARTEAEQKYLSMKSSIQEDLKSRMEKWIVSFKIEDYQFPTFHKVRHIAPYISAADCVNITTAMLNHPSTPTEKWEDWFYKAYDAIQVPFHTAYFSTWTYVAKLQAYSGVRRVRICGMRSWMDNLLQFKIRFNFRRFAF
jgi:cell division control protein 45